MIRYALVCDHTHDFESWFSTSAGFDEQAKRGLVACPVCGSAKVERAIMAPNVARTDRGRQAIAAPAEESPTVTEAPATPAPAPLALISEKDVAMRAMLAALHQHVATNAENVGKRFADEALKIHHGESDSRAIYGEATPEDARMLHEEGVEFMPLPRLPEGRN
ncbi:DUF1178 family protein [Bosea sp. PAMC 26642]|uniref:DUF1178 family protein n=1 Tax=Bosea sp. (strain PAMC 26642) TaxID=1792307 RepID=UPI0007703048|nr:DUF1178 family protein [Bosea sp. PAMC 26642]AMJ61285.1 hypothetical protein AXW83_14145 [Bosea sp. PAMC 26642]